MMGIRVLLAQLIGSVSRTVFEPSCNSMGLTALPSMSSCCKGGHYLLVFGVML